MRKLGYVRSHVSSSVVRSVLLHEILLRTIKNQLRLRLRQKTKEVLGPVANLIVRTCSSAHSFEQVPPMLLTPVQYAVVDFLNTVFADTKEAKKYWKEVLFVSIHSFSPYSMPMRNTSQELVAVVMREFPQSLSESEMENDLREFTFDDEEETDPSDFTQVSPNPSS